MNDMMYNPDVAEKHRIEDNERRARANDKGQIWSYGDGWAACVQL